MKMSKQDELKVKQGAKQLAKNLLEIEKLGGKLTPAEQRLLDANRPKKQRPTQE